ncbi:MAG: amino acid adenylation domain-containing protein [Halanaerobiales bacterium]|nr:amino acid adenylation domain-containing protein [Halanaerobiales bacterium]
MHNGIKDLFELTPIQKGILFHCLKEPDSNLYIEQFCFRIVGEVNSSLFAKAWKDVVANNEVLHSVIRWDKLDKPVMVIAEKTDVNINYYFLEDQKDLTTILSDDLKRGINIEKECFRVTLCTLGEDERYMIITSHHIFIDGWSSALILNEFLDAYNKGIAKKKTSYKEYIKYIKQVDHSDSLQFWKDQLSGFRKSSVIPFNSTMSSNEKRQYTEIVTPDLYTKIEKFIYTHELTLSSFFYVAWGLLLKRYNNETTFGITVSGRTIRDIDISQVVGLFINTIPMRLKINPSERVEQYIKRVRDIQVECQENSLLPLQTIKSCCTDSLVELFNTVMVVENYSYNTDLDEKDGINVRLAGVYENTHYDLIIQVSVSDRLQIKYLTKENGFGVDTLKKISKLYLSVIELMLDSETESIADILKDETMNISSEALSPLVVCSTFVSLPLKSYIEGWLRDFSWNTEVLFTDYNMIFQELIDENSLIQSNTGINLFIIRLEDFIRNVTEPKEQQEVLSQTLNLLIENFNNYSSEATTFIWLLNEETRYTLDPIVRQRLIEGYTELENYFDQLAYVKKLDIKELCDHYDVTEKYDSFLDQEAHIPYTDEYYAVLGTCIGRKLLAWRRHKVKMIVVDCDNTLWKGICGEDGWEGVQINETFQNIQKFLKVKKDEGFLLSICSKNNEEDVWNVFEKNPDMILSKGDFVCPKINWNDKSNNLREITHEVNIGLSSLAFVDDSIYECLNVIESCPEVLCFHLPENQEQIMPFLHNIWAFDNYSITQEDRFRTDMYYSETKRKEFLESQPSVNDFLKNLQIKVTLYPLDNEGIERASQLSYRTNQFTLNSVRKSEQNFLHDLKDSHVRIWLVEVQDIFGKYGVVGVISGRVENESLILDAFCLSCRVLGKNIEYTILQMLKEYCLEHGLTYIKVRYSKTEKNEPFHQFLFNSGWEMSDGTGNQSCIYKVCEDGNSLTEKIQHINYEFSLSLERDFVEIPEQEEQVAQKRNKPLPAIDETGWGCNNDYVLNEVYKTKVFDTQAEKSVYLKPLIYHQISQLVHLYQDKESALTIKNSLPESKIEEELLRIWEGVTGKHNIGVEDNYFTTGGNSVQATMLASRIHKRFDVKLSVADILRYTTIKQQAKYIKQKKADAYFAIKNAPQREYYDLSPAQRRIYIMHYFNRDSLLYNVPLAFELEGRLGLNRLEMAINKVVQRHEIFRTYFDVVDGKPVQRILDQLEVEIKRFYATEDDVESIVNSLVKPFDLSEVPLFRTSIVTVEGQRHILVFDYHHIIMDGQSIAILIEEINAFYQGEELEEIALQYKDYTEWYNSILLTEYMADQKEYWTDKLAGELPVLNLPTDSPRQNHQTFTGSTVTFQFDCQLSEMLKKTAENLKVTQYMLLLAVYNLFLYKYTGQKEIIVGTPVSCREHTDLEKVIGMFVNTLAMRNQIDPEEKLTTFVERVKGNSIEAYDNKDYLFDTLIDDLDLQRDASMNPLFSTMFVFQDFYLPELSFDSEIGKPYYVKHNVARFDLTLEIQRNSDEMIGKFEYNSNLFRESSIEKMSQHFLTLCEQVIKDQTSKVCEYSLLDELETQRILDFSLGESVSFEGKTIIELFEELVEKTPDNCCIVMDTTHVTYGELNILANGIAWRLRNSGVRPNDIVAILSEPSLEMAIGILGILKAGGAYLPILNTYPEERIKSICANCNIRTVVVQKEEEIDYLEGMEVIDLDLHGMEDESDQNPDIVNEDNDLAYVIYTSGTTGESKGVMIEHAGLSNAIQWRRREYDLSLNDTVLQLFSFAFDGFITSFFTPLISGTKIILLNSSDAKDVLKMGEIINQYKVTQFISVPTVFSVFLDYVEPENLKSLQKVTLAGEVVTDRLVSKSKRILPWVELDNEYGPTENSVLSSYKANLEEGQVTAGRPIANTSLYILDEQHKLVPQGVYGEIYLSGLGLARGYVNYPELPAEKFIPSPFNNTERLYQTGDRAKWIEDGEVVIVGRIDELVKINGYRVDLLEIDACVNRYSGIITSKTIVSKHKALTCYYESTGSLAENDIVDYLKKYLPDYMIPTVYYRVDRIPLLESGKIDITKLDEVKIIEGEEMIEYSQSERAEMIEKDIKQLYADVLRQDNIKSDSNFFELGGNSLNAVLLHKKIEELYPDRTNIADIFSYPTPQKIARFIDAQDQENLMPVYGLDFMENLLLPGQKEHPNFSTVQSKIEVTLFERMHNYVSQFNQDINTLFIAIFILLLDQVTHDDLVTTYLFDNETQKISIMQITVEEDIEFDQYVQVVSEKIEETLRTDECYELSDIKLEKNKYNDMVLIGLKNGYSNLPFELFDLVFYEVDYNLSEAFVCLNFNQDRFETAVMQQLLTSYVNLLSTII